MGGPYLHGEQGHFSKRAAISHQCWRKHVEQEEPNSRSQRHGVSWSRGIGSPVGGEPAVPQRQLPGQQGWGGGAGPLKSWQLYWELLIVRVTPSSSSKCISEMPDCAQGSVKLRVSQPSRDLVCITSRGTWQSQVFLTLNPEVNGNAYLYPWSIKGKSVLWEGRERNWWLGMKLWGVKLEALWWRLKVRTGSCTTVSSAAAQSWLYLVDPYVEAEC